MKFRFFKILFVVITFLTLNITTVYAVDSNTTSSSNVSNETSTVPNAKFMAVDQYVSCGGSSPIIKRIPSIIPNITTSVYNIIMVLVPIILIVMGSIDLVKGLMSQKDDEIKKGRDAFTKRLITGIIIFLIVLIVKFFVSALASITGSSSKILNCVECFIDSDSCTPMSGS